MSRNRKRDENRALAGLQISFKGFDQPVGSVLLEGRTTRSGTYVRSDQPTPERHSAEVPVRARAEIRTARVEPQKATNSGSGGQTRNVPARKQNAQAEGSLREPSEEGRREEAHALPSTDALVLVASNSEDAGSSASFSEPPNQEVLALRAQLASLRAVIARAGILPEGGDSGAPANPVPLGPPRMKEGPGVVVATQPGVAGGRAASEILSRPESRALTDSNRFSEKRAGEALASHVNVGAPTTDEGGGERRLKDKYVSTAARAGPRTRLVNDSETVQ